MEVTDDCVNSLMDRIIKACKTNDVNDYMHPIKNTSVAKYDNDNDNCDDDDDDDDDVERRTKIKKIHNYIVNQAPKNEDGWGYFRTCSRCEGFTIGYGSFYKINEIKQPKLILSEKDYDDNYEQREKINQSITNKCSEVTVVNLPCCWPNETKLDFLLVLRCIHCYGQKEDITLRIKN